MCLARQDSCLTGGTIGPHPRNIYFSVLETRSGLEYFLCRRTKSYTPELTSNDLDQEFSVHVFYDIVAVGINIETCMHVLSPGSAQPQTLGSHVNVQCLMFMILFCSHCIGGVQTQLLYTTVMACNYLLGVLERCSVFFFFWIRP